MMFNLIEKKFSIILEWVLIVFVNAIAILMFIQVIFRYFLNIQVNYIEEILAIPGIWFYILGSVYASKKEEHLNARIIEIFFKKIKSIAKLRAITASISLIVCGWLIYWSYDLLKYSIKVKKLSTILNYRMSILEVSLFVGFIFMFIYTLFEFNKYIKIIISNKEELI